MGDAQYQSVYNVGLLDDLHNYFPALLYQMERFHNLPQVFHYIRQQMNTRFNLYNYGASLAGGQSHGQRPYGRHVVPPSPMQYSPHMRAAAPAAAPPRRNIDLFTLASIFTELPTDIWTFGAANPIGLEPVVVRPSAQVIAQATEIVSGSTMPEGTLCSICQDSILATDSARKLRACNHLYHQVCIDQWFERSVLCPTCRHDVREA
uniref:RING-type domain-containing protein n=1 Tax=viral metagenome TaxID=1070528 RepID=A0A6C0KN72_9ZZZZ